MNKNKKLNILIILPGGIDISDRYKVIPTLRDLIIQLSKKHNVLVITLHQSTTHNEFRQNNYRVISLENVTLYNLHKRVLTLINSLEKEKFSPDLIQSFWLGLPTLFASILKLKYNTPLFAYIAGGEAINIKHIKYGGQNSIKSKIIINISRYFCTKFICNGTFSYNKISSLWTNPTTIIPLGINLDFWNIKKANISKNNICNIIIIATINNVKNPDLVLKVLSKLKKRNFLFHLSWIGEDCLNKTIHYKAKSLGLDSSINFLNFKTQKEIKKTLEDKIFILQCSSYESQGMGMIEATSQGVCPIGTNVGWLNDMNIGITEDTSFEENIANEIITLYNNYTQREERIINLQKWILENDVKKCSSKILRLYKEELK